MRLKILFIIFTFFCFFHYWAFSLTKEQKWKALESFTKKQYDLLFESELWINSKYSDIFSISRKVNIFDNLSHSAKSERLRAQRRVINTVNKISNLEDAIKMINLDIAKSMSEIKQANIDIVQTRKRIKKNSKTIEIIKEKIKSNTEILLEYIDYLYKKWNLAYNDWEIDNIKSILLNGQDISDMLNDLYFNSLVQIVWKKLIDKQKAYISELYIEKLNLEKEKNKLSLLRKQLIINQKNLSDKKKFKETLLEATKWKQKEYEKYLDKKLDIENNIRKIAVKEKIKLANIKNEILKKYNCKFVDLAKNSSEVRALKKNSPKCYDINKMIYSESKLNREGKISSSHQKVVLDWPVSPHRWITSFYHDDWYKKEFWVDHNAIDIRVAQGTPIKAPMDWYVIFVQKPVSEDYSFVAIKHYDWYITVYWHLSEVLVSEYDYIKKWEIFAKTGWEFWTKWAGYITSWAHLHFETFKDKEYVDPLNLLDLSYLDYNNLPKKYRLKYLFDFKWRKGYEYKDVNSNTKVFRLEWKTEIERQKFLLSKYANPAFSNWQTWLDESLIWNIDPSLTMCIWLAESGLWTNLTTRYNIWNVWNNDRWDRASYSSAREWISAIVYTLNNRFHKNTNRLDMLSWAWRKLSNLPSCKDKWEYCYATDVNHWHGNVVKCLSHLKWYLVEDDYDFRIIH